MTATLNERMPDMWQDGVYEEATVDGSSEIVQALTASGDTKLLNPPKNWFDDPNLSRPTPLTVTADGQVYGHIAPWHADHMGLPPGTKPPRSRHGYAFFKTGELTTDDGSDIPVGQLTLAGGHAPLQADAGRAVQHYDDTASAVADVNVGEDMHGIWVSGSLRPGVSPEEVRVLRASAPSGDWRPINGSLELVAVCQVNVPGFPVARTMVASGEMTALVAAGASAMYQHRQHAQVETLIASMEDRITRLEDKAGVTASAIVGEVQEFTTELESEPAESLIPVYISASALAKKHTL